MRDLVFGIGVGGSLADGPDLLALVEQADRDGRDGLDHVSLPDHPYLGDRLDAYATIGVLLGRTSAITAFANVTNLPARPAPVLARTIATLSALSRGRVVLGVGAGGLWDRITDLGVPRLSPKEAVASLAEAITLVRRLTGGGPPVTVEGRHHRVRELEPDPVPAPPVWTGSVGPRSLAVTGALADGWIPGHAADWRSPRYRESRPVIDEAAQAAGRDPRAIRTVFNLPGRITDRPLAATRDRDGRWLGGSPGQWVAELTAAVLDHHAGGFTLFSTGYGTQDARTVARWAGEVAPAVRETIAKEVGSASIGVR